MFRYFCSDFRFRGCFSFISKEKISKKSDTAILAFLPIFSLANLEIYLYESKTESVTVKICVAVCFICSTVMVIKHIKPVILKIASVIIPSLAILPLILFIGITLYPFAKITVVKSLPSPEGTYYAEVTDVDVGALGGDTCVHVHKTQNFDSLFFNISKIPQRVYLGEWKAYEDMQIYWKNEHCLVINEIEYGIK